MAALGPLADAAGVSAATPLPSMALWSIVHGLCLRDQEMNGNPSPCLKVDLDSGFAVIVSPFQHSEVLLVPTDRVTGIEDPGLLTGGTHNYWQDAWTSRDLFAARTGGPVPRDDVGMAINSGIARTQDQLHIHIDCLRPEVRDSLRRNEARIGAHWPGYTLRFRTHPYRVRKAYGEDLSSLDPFRSLAAELPAAASDMAAETLVVAGAIFADGRHGFYFLEGRAEPTAHDYAEGEELLDHACTALGSAPG